MAGNEFLAMQIIQQQLELLDETARKLVIDWFESVYLEGKTTQAAPPRLHVIEIPANIPLDRQIPKVAFVDGRGEFIEIIEDLKADSVSDAAIRASYVLVYAYQELMDIEEGVSSRNVVVPFLKRAGLYSGSMRAVLKKESDIERQGDMLSLTPAGLDKAVRYVKDIQDDSFTGRWQFSPAAQRHGGLAG